MKDGTPVLDGAVSKVVSYEKLEDKPVGGFVLHSLPLVLSYLQREKWRRTRKHNLILFCFSPCMLSLSPGEYYSILLTKHLYYELLIGFRVR